MANSTNQNMRLPSTPIFDGENCDFWSVKIKTILISSEVWEYVEDMYAEPEERDNLTNAQKSISK